jgi:SAM-dependent methyltransferase
MQQKFEYSEAFYKSVDYRASETATLVFKVLSRYIKGNSILDLGCGSGAWLRAALEHGYTTATGIDLSSSLDLIRQKTTFQKYISNRSLTLIEKDFVNDPLSNLDFADVSICLEVLEHLPNEIAKSLVKLLTETSHFVVFSAAQPGQGGTHHINEQPLTYWVEEFARYNYHPFDLFRTILANQKGIPRFYALNMLFFVNDGNLNSKKLILDEVSLNANKVKDLSQLDKRSNLERIRYTIVRRLSVKFVTRISKKIKY